MQPQIEEKNDSFFNQIAIWELSDEGKTEVAQTIIADVETGVEYWSQMILSAIIATLGLFINATPVVIGAMLIAPILRPIQAVAFATTTGNRRLFFKGLGLLILSFVVSVAAAVVMTRLLPFTQLTNEILMRIEPTIIDLGIAFASGLIAFLAFGFKKIAAGLAGVAMAASLVPPLGVIGIGIGLLNKQVATGSTLLFLTNLVAIIIGGVIIFYLFGYAPNQKKERKTSIVSTTFAVLFLIGLTIPLIGSFTRIIVAEQTKNTIQAITEGYLLQNLPAVTLESFNDSLSLSNPDNSPEGFPIVLNVRAPSDAQITQQHKDQLTEMIANALQKDIALTMTIIPYTSVKVEQAVTINPQKRATDSINQFLQTLYPPVILLEADYLQQSQSVLIAEFFTTEQFNRQRFKEQLEDHLADRKIRYDTLLITRKEEQNNTQQAQLTPEQLARQDRIDTLSSNFRSSFPQDLLQKLTLKQSTARGTVIGLFIITTDKREVINDRIQSRKTDAESIVDAKVIIEANIQFAETVVVE